MKNNRLILVTAILYLLAFICFTVAAAGSNLMVSKVLYMIASVCFLISSIGSFCTYIKNRKNSDEKMAD